MTLTGWQAHTVSDLAWALGALATIDRIGLAARWEEVFGARRRAGVSRRCYKARSPSGCRFSTAASRFVQSPS